MAARVISFRIDDDVLTELEKRKLRDESVMLTAQRILSEALGIIKSPDYVSVAELVDTALLPIQTELQKLGDAYNESTPQLKNSVWLLEQAVFGEKSLRVEIEELRSRLNVLESQKVESLSETPTTSPNAESSELIQRLSELLDTSQYPLNNATKLRRRLKDILADAGIAVSG